MAASYHELKAEHLGVSAVVARVERLLARIAPLDRAVLVRGETGSGKEFVARRLHRLSGRETFVAVNCAALAKPLAEAELFGQENGACTGADQTHTGAFERADGGTLFLDDIGDMPLHLQAKLLRVLQERALVRVGGRAPIAVDTRLVLATQQDLERQVANGRFRQDLLFSINAVELRLPPLRERREDILWLARRFLADSAARRDDGAPAWTLAEDAVRALEAHDWPGNVRELRHVIERAGTCAAGDRLRAADLFGPGPAAPPAPAMAASVESAPPPAWRDGSVDAHLADCGPRCIENRLGHDDGRISAAAERLDSSRRPLWERMKRLGIRRKD